MFFFHQNWSLLSFISLSSSSPVIHVNVDIKIKGQYPVTAHAPMHEKRIGFIVVVVFLISKSPGGCAIYRQNARVLEKFLECIGNQMFLLVVLRCARFSRRELR